MELKSHQLSVSNNQVDTASDRPLTRSEPAEVVRLRMEVEFQLAKTAYAQERQQLSRELKDTSFPEDEKSTIERLDDCERQFSRLYAQSCSGQRKHLVEKDERQKNQKLRSCLQRFEQEE